MPQNLDAVAVRAWSALALDALGQAREEIDAINVYPVADGDTGTNLYLTMESASQAIDAAFTGLEPAGPTLAEAVRAMAHGALIGARGNSGTILAELLRGMAQVLSAEAGEGEVPQPGGGGEGGRGVGGGPAGEGHGAGGGDAHHIGGARLALALGRASQAAYRAVAHPVEGTVLTVAKAAAEAAGVAGLADAAEATGAAEAAEATGARGAAAASPDCATVARAAYEGACAALDATPGQLAVLGRAGVVDAGGRGLVAVLGALVSALSGETVRPRAAAPTTPALSTATASCAEAATDGAGPAFEVIYLLEADDAAVDRLRARLDALGDSLVVVGGDGLWNVHVHVDDAGAAVEAGVEAGRPYRIRITHFGLGDAHTVRTQAPPQERAQRGIVAVVPGDGLAALYAEAGATTVPARAGEPPASGELVEAIRRAHAREVVLLPNDAELRHTAAAAAEQARSEGVRVALIPTRSAVQGIAALAVHEPDRRFDEDVVVMTSAAGATRYAELAVAERQSWTTAGICQAGDVLGLIDGDVAVIGPEAASTATAVLDRMLAAGGEMVTLVLGDEISDAVAERLEKHVRDGHLAVDTVLYRGGPQAPLLLIGVE